MTQDTLKSETRSIDWERLSREFLLYRPDEEWSQLGGSLFEQALVKPVPRFVGFLVEMRIQQGGDWAEAVRDLYGFLLEKRYQERLNLLHFAFMIFEEESSLPDAVIARTPFPHEEGTPSFRYHGDPDSVMVLPRERCNGLRG